MSYTAMADLVIFPGVLSLATDQSMHLGQKTGVVHEWEPRVFDSSYPPSVSGNLEDPACGGLSRGIFTMHSTSRRLACDSCCFDICKKGRGRPQNRKGLLVREFAS